MVAVDRAVLAHPDRLAAVRRARLAAATATPRSDAVARLAARVVGTATAAVVLVDDGHAYRVGGHNLPAEVVDTPTVPLSQSLARYVVAADGPVAVPDLAADPELSTHPALVRYGLRSFAGVPLRDGDGRTVGALVVADYSPRPWSTGDIDGLTEAAAVATPAEWADADPVLAQLDPAVLLRETPAPFVAVDTGGTIVAWNPAAERLFGWSTAEALGSHLDLFLVEPSGDELEHLLGARTAGSSQHTWYESGVARRRDGHQFPIEATALTLPSPAGPLVAAFLADATGEVTAQRAVDEQRSFLATVLESLQTMVAVCDSAGDIVLLNRAIREYFEVPPDFQAGNISDWEGTFREPDGSPLKLGVPLRAALDGTQISGVEVLMKPPSQPEGLFHTNARAIISEEGRRLGAVLAMHDITERRQAERHRSLELAVVKALTYARDPAEAGRDVLMATITTLGWPYAECWLVDDLGGVLRPVASRSADGVDNADPADQALGPGQRLAGRVWSGDAPEWTTDVTDPLGPDRLSMARRYGLHGVYALPVRGDEAVVGVLVLFTDSDEEPDGRTSALLASIATHMGAYLAHRSARGLAEELARSRDDFIALAGHAMRTPLTSIASYTELLLSAAERWGDEDRMMLDVIARHTTRLREIIDDLIDLASIESGHLALNRRRIDLVPMIGEAIAAQEAPASDNAVTLEAELPATAMLDGDPRRLGQMLANLLSNAVNYSPDGGTVRVRLVVDPAGPVTLTVSDQGVGVPVGERDQVFRRFFRSAAAIERGIGGTGLGLTIARAVVRAHGGTIALVGGRDDPAAAAGDTDTDDDVRDGTGTLVTVRLPANLR